MRPHEAISFLQVCLRFRLVYIDGDQRNPSGGRWHRMWLSFIQPPMLNCPVALVVSADRQVRRLISASLGQIGCTSLDVATGREGFECAGAAHVDLVIVD